MTCDIAPVFPPAHDNPRPSPARRAAPWLSTLTYRSRAVTPLTELELHRLSETAQRRNRAEGVTGVMVYDSGWIFQQLEGPRAGLARIWDSIRRDARHEAIQVLGDAPTRRRRFADCDLQLLIGGAGAGRVATCVAENPPEPIACLCRGEPVDSLMTSAWWQSAAEPLQALSVVDAAEALEGSRAVLSDLVTRVIVPRLCAASPAPRGAAPADPPAELARLLIEADTQPAIAFARTAHRKSRSLAEVVEALLEPAARCLGNFWQIDVCNDLDVTLGLIRLQAIMRELGADAPRLALIRAPVVMVVPHPGEVHMLGAALDAELLWHAGWDPLVDFPASSRALEALVGNTWVDALDLSLSTAFLREHRLAQVGETIARARRASLNPDLVVVVSGRVFGRPPDRCDTGPSGQNVGADASFASATQAESTILQALRRPVADLQAAARG